MTQQEKIVILDSSTIINLALNGLLDMLKKLKEKTKARFFITPSIKYEVIDRPIKSKEYHLAALQIKSLVDSGVIELSRALNVSDEEIRKETKNLLSLANSTFFAESHFLQPIDEGEISCLVFYNHIKTDKKVIALDERSTRMLCENPENLRKLFERKFHVKVEMNSKNLKSFQNFKIIRSSEIAYAAYKLGLIELKNHDVLDALLYATKFKGASISREEISEIKKIR